jgi:hypothetical protein
MTSIPTAVRNTPAIRNRPRTSMRRRRGISPGTSSTLLSSVPRAAAAPGQRIERTPETWC